jgi:hypothetical protein
MASSWKSRNGEIIVAGVVGSPFAKNLIWHRIPAGLSYSQDL